MVTHVRNLILQSIVSRLTGLAPLFEASLLAVKNPPAIAYEITEDKVIEKEKDNAGTSYLYQTRELSVLITVVALSASARDSLALSVEQAMAPDLSTQEPVNLVTTKLVQDLGKGDTLLYGAQLEYEIKYTVRADNPDA